MTLPSHTNIVHHDDSLLFNSTAPAVMELSPPVSGPASKVPTNKSNNRWTVSEVRILIEQVGKQHQALQQARDPREKGRIWDKIIFTIKNSDMTSLALKERTKASVQQKWESLLQRYHDIKDKISRTGEEAVQNEWEFFNDMDEYLKEDVFLKKVRKHI